VRAQESHERVVLAGPPANVRGLVTSRQPAYTPRADVRLGREAEPVRRAARERTSGRGYTIHLAQNLGKIADMLENVQRDDRTDRRSAERQRFSNRRCKCRPSSVLLQQPLGHDQPHERDIDTNRALILRERRKQPACAAPDFQYRTSSSSDWREPAVELASRTIRAAQHLLRAMVYARVAPPWTRRKDLANQRIERA
jgi:hypothetical protein